MSDPLERFEHHPARLAELREGSLGQAKADEILRLHAVWLVRFDELGQGAEPVDGLLRDGPVNARLTGHAGLDERGLVARMDPSQYLSLHAR